MAKKLNNFESGDICYAYYVFDEEDTKGKELPIAVLLQVSHKIAKVVGQKSSESKYICYPVTSQKPPEDLEDTFYFIKDWQQSGLNRPSWIKCLPVKSRIYEDTDLDYKGRLTSSDIKGFSEKALATSSNSAKKEV